MADFYLSSYCVAFQDYPWLYECVNSFEETVGVEFAAGFPRKGMDPLLMAQIPVFSEIPALLHAPYVEICTEPGSKEEQQAEEEFQKACCLYRDFHASSMVFHTNEGSFGENRRSPAQKRSLEVLAAWGTVMKEQGIHASVENVGYPGKNNQLFDQEEFIAIFDRLSNEWDCLIDIGHAALNGWDVPQVIRRLKHRICGYHLNNNDGIHDCHYPLYDADGILKERQIDEILAAAAEFTPHANFVLEYAPGERISQKQMQKELRRIQRILR